MPMCGMTELWRIQMRRFLTVALLGLAVVSTSTVASAQGRGRGRAARPPARAAADTARARRLDSARVARGGTMDSQRRRADSARVKGDSATRRRMQDSVRARQADGDRGRGRGDFRPTVAGLAGIQLSESEKANVKAIQQKYQDEMKELRKTNAAGGATPELREKLQAIGERERTEIRAALSTEHQAQFDANIAKGGRGRGRGGR
jgi:hypothetical protein